MNVSKVLQQWYHENKRDLPWRHTGDPYKIWISEIILQQTRVQQGLSYYLKFINRFPDIYALAEAGQDEVMAVWKGLGYYSRARHLHSTARKIVESFGGKFPEKYEELIRLKGIGPYTAAAVASFAFGEPRPVVDGNVSRVISRLFGISIPVDSAQGKKFTEDKALEIIDKNNPGTHNQAIMEFGALICTPARPACQNCPLSVKCAALSARRTGELPVKAKVVVRSERFFNYLLVTDGTYMLVRKRRGADIWKGLYEFPLLETDSSAGPDVLRDSSWWREIEAVYGPFEAVNCTEKKKHHLTHRVIVATLCTARCRSLPPGGNLPYEIVPVTDWHRIPFPRPIEKYLETSFPV